MFNIFIDYLNPLWNNYVPTISLWHFANASTDSQIYFLRVNLCHSILLNSHIFTVGSHLLGPCLEVGGVGWRYDTLHIEIESSCDHWCLQVPLLKNCVVVALLVCFVTVLALLLLLKYCTLKVERNGSFFFVSTNRFPVTWLFVKNKSRLILCCGPT